MKECNLESGFYQDLNLHLPKEVSKQGPQKINLCFHLQIRKYLQVRTSFFIHS